MFRTGVTLVLLALLAAAPAAGQSVREHTRLAPRGTTVTDAQAEALTLTVTAATSRLVQSWVRTAATVEPGGQRLSAVLSGPEAALVQAGQRARAFPPSSKSSMYQARVTRVVARASGGATVEADLASAGRRNTTLYVLEIVVERGPYLAVPNEAIIEEGDRHIVYVQRQPGQYVPQVIETGIQGELLTQVLDGLEEGEEVVTFGSFFIDAEHKLKGIEQGAPDPPTQ